MSIPQKPQITGTSRFKIRVSSAGLHFFNRASGINVLVDEIKPPPEVWSAAPRQVSIALTNACNLECSYCYAPKQPAVLAFEKLTGWLAELDVNGCIGVGFGGGEPTLYPRLAELCSFTTKETHLAVTMTTHAHQLSNQMLSELNGNLNFVRISMDGVGSTYEALRGKSFDALIDRVKALSRLAPFGFNFVVNSSTIKDLDSATELAVKLGASEFLLLPEVPVRGREGIDDATIEKIHEWVRKYRGSIPLSVSQSGAHGLPTCDPLSSETGLAAFAHIDACGFLKRTSFDSIGTRIGESGILAALRFFNTANRIYRQMSR